AARSAAAQRAARTRALQQARSGPPADAVAARLRRAEGRAAARSRPEPRGRDEARARPRPRAAPRRPAGAAGPPAPGTEEPDADGGDQRRLGRLERDDVAQEAAVERSAAEQHGRAEAMSLRPGQRHLHLPAVRAGALALAAALALAGCGQ